MRPAAVRNLPHLEPESVMSQLDPSTEIAGKPTSRAFSHTMLLAAVAVTALGQTLVFTLLPSLGRATGMTEMQVGLIISCSSLVFALASPVWGLSLIHI